MTRPAADMVRELAIHVEELIFDGDTECGTRLRCALARARLEGREEAMREAAAEADAAAMRLGRSELPTQSKTCAVAAVAAFAAKLRAMKDNAPAVGPTTERTE